MHTARIVEQRRSGRSSGYMLVRNGGIRTRIVTIPPPPFRPDFIPPDFIPHIDEVFMVDWGEMNPVTDGKSFFKLVSLENKTYLHDTYVLPKRVPQLINSINNVFLE